jgi:hypothetical protein
MPKKINFFEGFSMPTTKEVISNAQETKDSM